MKIFDEVDLVASKISRDFFSFILYIDTILDLDTILRVCAYAAAFSCRAQQWQLSIKETANKQQTQTFLALLAKRWFKCRVGHESGLIITSASAYQQVALL